MDRDEGTGEGITAVVTGECMAARVSGVPELETQGWALLSNAT